MLIGKKVQEGLDREALLTCVPQFDGHGLGSRRQQTRKIRDQFAILSLILSGHGTDRYSVVVWTRWAR